MDTLIKILAQYDISETEPRELVRESGDNQVYIIGANDKKVLRLCKRLPIEDVRFEYEALQHLFKNGCPVPEWIKTNNGNFYASSEEIEVAVMFDFLEGYHVKIDKDHLPTKKQAYTAGNTLGKIAKIGQTFKPSSSRHRDIFIELERVLQNKEIFKKDFKGGEIFVDQIKESILLAQKQNTPEGLIHNDYHAGNVFFKTDTKVNGVIDFDWSCIGPSIKDLAFGIVEWSFPDGAKEPDFEIFDSFLEGYNVITKGGITKGEELYSWIMFSTLSATATFFCDRLKNPEQKKEISYSHMYNKYLFFSNL